jgi:hypothetical protein
VPWRGIGSSCKWPTWRTILFSICYFFSILYMFRATSCSSSAESIVSIQHLVCRWPSSMQVGKFLPDLHTRRSPTQIDIHQMLYWYNWFSWWWARGCSKHVENWNKQIEKKNCASSWLFTRSIPRWQHGQQNIKFWNLKVLKSKSGIQYDQISIMYLRNTALTQLHPAQCQCTIIDHLQNHG